MEPQPLSEWLQERAASEAETILIEAGVERVDDLQPLMNMDDLTALGLSRRVSNLILGNAEEIDSKETPQALATAAVPLPRATARRASDTGRDLAAWLAAHNLQEAAAPQ